MSEFEQLKRSDTDFFECSKFQAYPANVIEKRSLLRKSIATTLASSVMLLGLGKEDSSIAQNTSPPASPVEENQVKDSNLSLKLGMLVNPNLPHGMEIGNNTVQNCQYYNTGRVGKPIIRKQRIKVNNKKNAVDIRTGLADIQESSRVIPMVFYNSCEKVATKTTVTIDLVKKTRNKKGYSKVKTFPAKKTTFLKTPGYKGVEYMYQIWSMKKYKNISRNSLEWNNSRFQIPQSKNFIGQYGVRTTISSKPLFNINCDQLKEKYPQQMDENDVKVCKAKINNGEYPLKLKTMNRIMPIKWIR